MQRKSCVHAPTRRPSPIGKCSRLGIAAALMLPVAGCAERPSPLAEQMKPQGIEKEFRPAKKPAAPR